MTNALKEIFLPDFIGFHLHKANALSKQIIGHFIIHTSQRRIMPATVATQQIRLCFPNLGSQQSFTGQPGRPQPDLG